MRLQKTILLTGLKNYSKVIISVLSVFFLHTSIYGQQPGSITYQGNSSVGPRGTLEFPRETVVFSGTYKIDGVLNIYSRNIVFHPDAVFTGAGVINIYNANVLSSVTDGGAITTIDGNNMKNPIQVKVVLHNPMGMQIGNKSVNLAGRFSADDAANATPYFGDTLNLAADGANIFLGVDSRGDLRFARDDQAKIINFSSNRMVITNNSITSHMVKELLEGSVLDFTYPVGISAGDLTVVKTGNIAHHYDDPSTVNSISVSVVDYAAAATSYGQQTPSLQTGMDRMWHVYSDGAISHTGPGLPAIEFVHNAATNGTDFPGSGVPTIGRYIGGGWVPASSYQSATSDGTDMIILGNQTGRDIGNALADNAGWITKMNNVVLPVVFGQISAILKGDQLTVTWKTQTESNNDHLLIEASNDGKNFHVIGKVKSLAPGGNSSTPIDYKFETKISGGVSVLGGSVAIFVLCIGMIALGRKRRSVPICTLVIGIGLFINFSCNKTANDLRVEDKNKMLFVRITQVDKDGIKSNSKIVQVVANQ